MTQLFDFPGAIAIARRSGAEQQAREHNSVAVDDPPQSNKGRRKLQSDRRQSEVHDRGIKDDHEESGIRREQRGSLVQASPPPPALDHDAIRQNRIMISSLCLSMIPRVEPKGMLFGKPVSTFPDHALTSTLLHCGRHAILNLGDSGTGAGLVLIASGSTADAQRRNDLVASLDRHATCKRKDIRQG
jgi:hypothetical protein